MEFLELVCRPKTVELDCMNIENRTIMQIFTIVICWMTHCYVMVKIAVRIISLRPDSRSERKECITVFYGK